MKYLGVWGVALALLLSGCEQKRPEGETRETSLAAQRAGGVPAAMTPAVTMGNVPGGAEGALSATPEADVPAEAAAAYQAAQDRKRQGDVAGAIEQYKKAISVYGKFPTAYRALGYAYFQNNQLNEAIAAYEKAIELKPDYVDAYTGLSMLYFQTGQVEKATAAQNKAKALGVGAAGGHATGMEGVLPPNHPAMGMPKDASGQTPGSLPPGHPPIKTE